MARDDDMRKRLDDEPEDFPESWISKPGDTIAGVVRKYTEATTEYQGKKKVHPICVLETDGGTVRSVWLMHTVLLDEFRTQRPVPGERIGIKRLTDSDKGYKRYTLIVDREDVDTMEILYRTGEADDVDPGDRDELHRSTQAEALAPDGAATSEQEFSNEALAGEDDLPF